MQQQYVVFGVKNDNNNKTIRLVHEGLKIAAGSFCSILGKFLQLVFDPGLLTLLVPHIRRLHS